MFLRSVRTNNNSRQADNRQATGNQQVNQQAPSEVPTVSATNSPPESPPEPPNNANNLFVIRGTYRRRVNHLVERLRNNFYNNVLGDNNNNNLQNQPGFNNLTRSLRLLNLLFPNRPILNVRIINVRSASASASVADILRTAEENQIPANQANLQQAPAETSAGVVRLERAQESGGNNEEESPTATISLADEQPPPDPSQTPSHANVEPEISIKQACDDNVNNSMNVMQSSSNGDGESSQTTSSSNEQCWAWMKRSFLWILIIFFLFPRYLFFRDVLHKSVAS